MKKSFVYEYETTRERKFWNKVENFVNHALTISFGMMIIGGIAFAIINLI